MEQLEPQELRKAESADPGEQRQSPGWEKRVAAAGPPCSHCAGKWDAPHPTAAASCALPVPGVGYSLLTLPAVVATGGMIAGRCMEGKRGLGDTRAGLAGGAGSGRACGDWFGRVCFLVDSGARVTCGTEGGGNGLSLEIRPHQCPSLRSDATVAV